MIIFISGKYSKGNINKNIKAARKAAIEVWEAGHVAFCPHLNTAHFEKDCNVRYEDYLAGDLEILKRCDAILMLPGWEDSIGASKEHYWANVWGKTIYYYPFIPPVANPLPAKSVYESNSHSASFEASTWFSKTTHSQVPSFFEADYPEATYVQDIHFYRKNTDIEGPTRKTPKSVGFDIRASEDVFIANPYSEPVVIPTGLIVQAPPNYWYSLHLRSGFAIKNDLSLVNDVGIIDEDYCGPDDEIKIYVRSNSKGGIQINRGDRVAQIIFHRNDILIPRFVEEASPDFAKSKSRGGIGSTGEK